MTSYIDQTGAAPTHSSSSSSPSSETTPPPFLGKEQSSFEPATNDLHARLSHCPWLALRARSTPTYSRTPTPTPG
jgi:hypothetical protein